MELDGLQSGIDGLVSNGKNVLSSTAGTVVASALGGALLGGAIVAGTSAIKKRSSTTRRKSSTKKSKSRKRKYKYARTAGKRKDTSRKRIRMTKNGQPYVIQANGRARFISKASARNSRRRKGGRY